MQAMTLLAIDCAASLCAACVYDAATDAVLGQEVRDLGKGHAEHLMEVIASALAAAVRNALLYRSLLEAIEDVAEARRAARR